MLASAVRHSVGVLTDVIRRDRSRTAFVWHSRGTIHPSLCLEHQEPKASPLMSYFGVHRVLDRDVLRLHDIG
jgi:hypothetical protein